MEIITLYRLIRPDGGVTVTPIKPTQYESTLYRLIADEGKILVNGDIETECIDTESKDDWTEKEKQDEINSSEI